MSRRVGLALRLVGGGAPSRLGVACTRVLVIFSAASSSDERGVQPVGIFMCLSILWLPKAVLRGSFAAALCSLALLRAGEGLGCCPSPFLAPACARLSCTLPGPNYLRSRCHAQRLSVLFDVLRIRKGAPSTELPSWLRSVPTARAEPVRMSGITAPHGAKALSTEHTTSKNEWHHRPTWAKALSTQHTTKRKDTAKVSLQTS